MRKILIFIVFCCVCIMLQAQEDNGVRIILKASLGELQNTSFYIYNPPFKAKAIYRDTIQAINKYPEQLMSSIMSENNESWYYYNNKERKSISSTTEKRLKKAGALNKESNFQYP